jgi:hypothetical protein
MSLLGLREISDTIYRDRPFVCQCLTTRLLFLAILLKRALPFGLWNRHLAHEFMLKTRRRKVRIHLKKHTIILDPDDDAREKAAVFPPVPSNHKICTCYALLI